MSSHHVLADEHDHCMAPYAALLTNAVHLLMRLGLRGKTTNMKQGRACASVATLEHPAEYAT